MVRRDLPAGSILAICLIACSACRGRDSSWFGDTTPPASQKLTFDNNAEPSSLDPAKATTLVDANVVGALFEGLVQDNPLTSEPMAALATHYEVSANGTRYVFYLRGHPSPRGARLPGSDSLPAEFSHGVPAPPDSVPARWSDGTVITAHDFEYAWRRVADPRTAAVSVDYIALLKNGEAIVAGKRPPKDLGVRAADDFTLKIDLEQPAPYLLSLLAHTEFRAVPRIALEKADRAGRGDRWFRPESIVTSGPFHLVEWRPYDYVRVGRSATYYQADLVRLQQIDLLPVSADSAVANLYRTGATQAMIMSTLPEALAPALFQKKDFHSDPAFANLAYSINVHRRPFDNVLVRYALNMSIDKAAIAAYRNAEPARTVTPAVGGYEAPRSLPVSVGGRRYDVLEFNPAAARELLAQAGYPDGAGSDGKPLAFDLRSWESPTYLNAAEIMAQQWRTNLHIRPRLVPAEYNPAIADMRAGNFAVITDAWSADFNDPLAMLTPAYVTVASGGWTDTEYLSLLDDANRTQDPVSRFKKLALAEARLMHEMPIIPVNFDRSHTLLKPYVRGLRPDLLSYNYFRYAWIDTGWRP
jgi:ABC-type oligopeptide transport system substrate-binding subunit